MKGDLKSSIEWDPSLVGSLGLSCRYKRFLFCHWCFTAQWKIFFPHRTPYLKSSVPLRPASWAGSRAGSPVSLSVSLIRDECLVSRDVFCHSFIRTLSQGIQHFYVLIKRLNLIFKVFIIFGCILKIVCHFLKVYFASIYMCTVIFCEYL